MRYIRDFRLRLMSREPKAAVMSDVVFESATILRTLSRSESLFPVFCRRKPSAISRKLIGRMTFPADL